MSKKKTDSSTAKPETGSSRRHRKASEWVAPGQSRLPRWTELEDKLRREIFAELKKYDIPKNLVDAVRDFGPHASIQNLPEQADEVLAKFLRVELSRTRAERGSIRTKGLLERNVIARVAIDMLEKRVLSLLLPGNHLVKLLRALLDADKRPLKSEREFESRYRATWILVKYPDVGIRKLARYLGVNATSVSRWRKESSFWEEVESRKRTIKRLDKLRLWLTANGPESNQFSNRTESDQLCISLLHGCSNDLKQSIDRIEFHAGQRTRAAMGRAIRKIPGLDHWIDQLINELGMADAISFSRGRTRKKFNCC